MAINVDTSRLTVSRGVHQGRALSPTLLSIVFIGSIDELPAMIEASINADDLFICASGRTCVRLQVRQRANYAAILSLK